MKKNLEVQKPFDREHKKPRRLRIQREVLRNLVTGGDDGPPICTSTGTFQGPTCTSTTGNTY